MRYDTVIFDLDGTLTDSAPGITNGVKYALEKMGYAIPSQTELLAYIGPPLAHSFMHYAGMNEQDANEAVRLYREYYIPVGSFENSVYPGIRELLKSLKDEGAKLYVATGKITSMASNILDFFGLTQYFDKIFGSDPGNIVWGKKELIEAVLKDNPNGHAVMIGDRDNDLQGAEQAGVDGIGAGYGFAGEGELEKEKHVFIAGTVSEMSEFLLGYVPGSRGYFISMEGLDGCGKTTQANAIEAALTARGYTVRRTREPGGCMISEKIRDLLLDVKNTGMESITEVLLYASARAQLVREVIEPAIKKGEIILCDRFVDSSVAFQGGGRELGVKLIEQVNAPAVGDCHPDTTIYLKIDHETSLKRRGAASKLDRIESEKAAFHARVEAAYDELAEAHSERFITVDARKKPEEITSEVLEKLYERMKKAGVA